MDIRIKTTDYEMPPEVATYLEGRIASLERLIAEDAHHARFEVEVGRDGGSSRRGDNMWFAEIRVIIPGDRSCYARNNSESVNGAIDDVKEEVERQLRKRKRYSTRFLRRSGALAKRLLRFGRSE